MKVARLIYLAFENEEQQPIKVVTTLNPLVVWLLEKGKIEKSARWVAANIKKEGLYIEGSITIIEIALHKGGYEKK
jgi:hypothetical protein